MFNLVAFPHYTCGGLLCDILNDHWGEVGLRGDIVSDYHSLGKIGDSSTVFTNFDIQHLLRRLDQLTIPPGSWIGSHCWPDEKLIDSFDRIILISTATSRSQIYRWSRVYHHFFKKQWKNLSGIEKVDKMRETAKNYVIPFEPVHHPKVNNLEFADVVECSAEFFHVVNNNEFDQHIKRWQEINYFLYEKDFWHSEVVKTFYQAEHEIKLGRYYRYE